jgi:hypothetical protein
MDTNKCRYEIQEKISGMVYWHIPAHLEDWYLL